MKTVWIIGIGMGPDTVTAEGLRAIEQADMLIGAKRMVAGYAHLGKPSTAEYAPGRVAEIVREHAHANFAVLVSGDVGFYSAAEGLLRALDCYEVRLIPGISSFHYFFARLQKPWQNAAAISCHGRESNLVDTVRRNGCTFALTGGNVSMLAGALEQAGFGGLTAYVGEDLGMETEKIFSCPVRELPVQPVGSLAVLVVENPDADASIRTGISDDEFVRGAVPMTKAEVRAVILSKLGLVPDDICVDVGAGTGSVTVEMALSAWRGHVYAIDKNEEAVGLIRENCAAFHIGNVTPLLGDALEKLKKLPAVDAAFIGGSGGEMRELVRVILEKNPAARIVISAIALESVSGAI